MAQTRDEERLANAPIGPLMLKLAVPAVAAQVINMLYNIVDRIYIGHIPEVGDIALTGVGVTFPIIMLVSAFAAFAGQGGAPLASIQLGAGNREKAEKILGNSLTLLLIAAVALTVGFSIFKEPILYAFGASENTIGYAMDYIGIYLIGTIFVQLALGLNTFISAQGKALVAMLSVLIGAVLNICLDPVFIFGLHMGVKGAALATILSGGKRSLGGRLPVQPPQRPADPEEKYAPGAQGGRPGGRFGRGSLYYAVYGEPGDRGSEHRYADLRR